MRYRYRTCVLVGPWRDTREEAIADALRARQARRSDVGADVVWVGSGAIEEGPSVGVSDQGRKFRDRK
jgi:hypothetical protein